MKSLIFLILLQTQISLIEMNQIGIARLELFDFSGAVRAFESSLKLAPETHELKTNLILAHFYSGALDVTSTHLKNFLELFPEDPWGNYLSGLLAVREGRIKAARIHFNAVLLEDPADWGALFQLAKIEQQVQNHDKALELFEKALKNAPEEPVVLYIYGRALLEAGRVSEAKQFLYRFQKAKSAQPASMRSGMGEPVVLSGEYAKPRRLAGVE